MRNSNRSAAWVALALALAVAAPGRGQTDPDRPVSEVESQIEDLEDGGYLDEAADSGLYLLTPARPWTLGVWLPANWQTNLASSENGLRAGVALEPELTLERTWGAGGVRLFTELGAFLSFAGPDPSLDASGWWGTARIFAGDRATGPEPYLEYAPTTLHAGVFDQRLLTLHDISAGVRRSWGPTALHLFLLRQEASTDAAERWTTGVQLQWTRRLGEGLALNLRGDGEYRRYDWREGARREDVRGRLRARLFVTLDDTAELVLTADLQHRRSNQPGASFTNLILGPALSVPFGF